MEATAFLDRKILVKEKPCKICCLLGEGSHAFVYKAKTLYYPYEEITIKVAKETKGIPKERLENEIWLLREIFHLSVPLLLDSGSIEDHLWMAMPVYQKLAVSTVDKGAIKNFYPEDFSPQGYPSYAKIISLKIRENIAISVLKQIGEVIVYIAGTGILHGDISPGNIMEKQGSRLKKEYVLTDWGTSALLHRYPSKSFGSLHFTAPERLLGECGIKSDLFSLGVVCFYIVTGTVPYSGETPELYYLCAVERNGISASEIEKNISPAFDKILRDMIDYKASNRPEPQEIIKKIQKL